MIGISAGLAADARNFANEFTARWGGEPPAPNAHYYFDAMLLAGMAYRFASATLAKAGASGPPSAADLASALVAVSGPGGNIRTWQEVGEALRAIENGDDIDYRGTSGPVDFSADGDVPQGFVREWTIQDGAIESL
jgi:neutral amino acid transport system substrate-binding protein